VHDDDRRLLRRLGYGEVLAVDVGPLDPRPAGDVLDRALALDVVVAVAGGLDATSARRLLDGFDVAHALDDGEHEYLADVADGIRVEDTLRALDAEAVALLAWALDLAPAPPLDEPSGRVRLDPPAAPALRPLPELRRHLELHEAMAWSLRADPDLAVGAAPGPVDPYVVHRRHAALRWLLRPPPPNWV